MRVLAVALGAITLALAAVLAAIALRYGAMPAGPDAAGFAVATVVATALLVGVVYWPVLATLRRRRGRLSPARAALLTTFGLNAPVYAALAVLGRERRLFAGDEVFFFAVGIALVGVLFGAGYARTHRAKPV